MNERLPSHSPDTLDAATALALRFNPPRMGRWAMERRRALFGNTVRIQPRPALELSESDALAPLRIRGGGAVEAPGDWSTGETWAHAGDSLIIPLDPLDPEGPARYVAGLIALGRATRAAVDAVDAPERSLAPYCEAPAGTFRLWAIAVARLVLPASIRVEARHDLVGIRLAQIALGFGADTLSGPIEADRALPIAGVTRPNEATRAGLHNLVEQAGMRPVDVPLAS